MQSILPEVISYLLVLQPGVKQHNSIIFTSVYGWHVNKGAVPSAFFSSERTRELRKTVKGSFLLKICWREGGNKNEKIGISNLLKYCSSAEGVK